MGHILFGVYLEERVDMGHILFVEYILKKELIWATYYLLSIS